MHVWLLRHGASTFNQQHRCQGCSDVPELTAQGREGARLTGNRLASEKIQVIISSPLRRAAKTAEEVLKTLRAQGCAVAFETDTRLREIELYCWEGLPIEEIPRRFREQYIDWRLRPYEFCVQSADTQSQYPVRRLYGRVDSFLNDLLENYPGKTVLLVAHSGTIRALVTLALGLGAEHFHSVQQSNCGLSRLRFSSCSRQAKLDLLNDTAHLGENLPKLKEGRCGMRLLLIPLTVPRPAALLDLASTLDDIVIKHVIAVGGPARGIASELFPSSCHSCLVVPEAKAALVVAELLHQYFTDELQHVAIIGPPAILHRVLQQQLGISDGAADSLELHPLKITPVHRPGTGVPPILQSLNLSKPSPALLGVDYESLGYRCGGLHRVPPGEAFDR